ncbi:MAG: hypothetical protein ACFCVC_06535 [Acidimicrobiia bacterium]
MSDDTRLRELTTRVAAMAPEPVELPVSSMRDFRVRRWPAVAVAAALVVAIGLPAGLLLRGDPGPVSDRPPLPVLPAATAHVEIEIPWFDGAERGTTYELTPDDGGWGFQRRVWFSAEETSGPTGIGTDRLRLPGRTGEGWHTLCEELSGRCFRIEMVAPEQAPNIRALLPPAAPGDVVMLPLLPAVERTPTLSMASAEEPGVPLFELTGPDHVAIPDIAPPGAYLICSSGEGDPCYWIEIVAPSPDHLGTLPPVQPGDRFQVVVIDEDLPSVWRLDGWDTRSRYRSLWGLYASGPDAWAPWSEVGVAALPPELRASPDQLQVPDQLPYGTYRLCLPDSTTRCFELPVVDLGGRIDVVDGFVAAPDAGRGPVTIEATRRPFVTTIETVLAPGPGPIDVSSLDDGAYYLCKRRSAEPVCWEFIAPGPQG